MIRAAICSRLGVLLYFFSTGERPFGESQRLSIMKQAPLARSQPCPGCSGRIIRRGFKKSCCAASKSSRASRYPSVGHLAFELSNYSQIKLTARSGRRKRDSFLTVMQRRFNPDLKQDRTPRTVATPLPSVPIIAVAVDLIEDAPGHGRGVARSGGAGAIVAARSPACLP